MISVTYFTKMNFSHNFNFRQGKNELATAFREFTFAFQDIMLEMPGKNQEIVWFPGMGFFFGNDWDVGPRRIAAEFVQVNVGNTRYMLACYAAELQEDVTLRGSAVPEYCFPSLIRASIRPNRFFR